MATWKYLIVGGGLAGGRACQGIRKVDPEGTLALVAGENHLPYERPALSKGYLTRTQGLDHVYWKDETFFAENHIEVIQGIPATKLDPAAHRITLEDGRVLEYKKLLLATGGRAWRLPIPGNDLPGVHTLRTIEDSEAIREAAKSARHALVLGGSFIGSEAAASLAQLGVVVTMVFPESRLLERVVPEELSTYLRDKFEANGVRFLTGTKPGSLGGDGRVERAILDSRQTIDADLVVMGVGIRLNTELAREAGLEMWDRGAISVDEFLRTSASDIYAAGDIAAWPDPTFDKRMRVEHWDVAYRQGMRAGGNMAGEAKPYTTLPYFFSDLFDLSFEAWGDLADWDQTVRRGALESGKFAYYYFHGEKMVGVLAMGRPDTERKPMQALVRARPTYEATASRLADEQVDLGTLVV